MKTYWIIAVLFVLTASTSTAVAQTPWFDDFNSYSHGPYPPAPWESAIGCATMNGVGYGGTMGVQGTAGGSSDLGRVYRVAGGTQVNLVWKEYLGELGNPGNSYIGLQPVKSTSAYGIGYTGTLLAVYQNTTAESPILTRMYSYTSDGSGTETCPYLAGPALAPGWWEFKIEAAGRVVSAYYRQPGTGDWNLIGTQTQDAGFAPNYAGFALGSRAFIDDVRFNGDAGTNTQPQLPGRHFGKNWVRNHPFTIMSWYGSYLTNELVNGRYQGCGMNTLMNKFPDVINAAPQYGLAKEAEVSCTEFNQAVIDLIGQQAGPYEDNMWYVNDEPAWEGPNDLIPVTAQTTAYLRQNRPNGLTSTNVVLYDPLRDTYILNTVQPDAYFWDYYPYCVPNTTEDPDGDGETWINFFYYQRGIYNITKLYDIPVFFWVEAFAAYNEYRAPSESEMRMLVFSSLTTGCKGIGYFQYALYPYDPQTPVEFTDSLILGNGQPSTLYYYAQAVNGEISRLGRYLRCLESTDYGYVCATGNNPPSGLFRWSPGMGGDTHITEVSVSGSGGKQDGMIGFFTDDAGGRYFMLTNLNRGMALSATGAQSTFTIHFDDTVSQVYRLNRITGQQEVIPMTDMTPGSHHLDILLPGGTGDLFSYSGFPQSMIDEVVPTGSISVNSGAISTASTSVTLTLSASDNSGFVSFMRFSNEGGNWSGWQGYDTTKSWTLPSWDGVKNVSVQFKDPLGNISAALSDSIILDTIAPQGSILINSNAPYTNSTSVTLTLSASDVGGGVAQMQFTNNGSTWSAWEPYFTSKPWTLATGDGSKPVGTRFKDDAGNVSTTSMDYITLDTALPTPGTASSPGSVTSSPIRLTYSGASDSRSGLKKVELWHKKEIGGSWTNSGLSSATASGSFDFAPSLGNGTYYFDLVAEDNAGNRSAAPAGSGDTSTALTLPTVGITNRAAVSALVTTAALSYNWVLWGKVSDSDASGFKIDDGSGVVIKVVPADSTVHDGDYVSVKGFLDVGTIPPTLTSQWVTNY